MVLGSVLSVDLFGQQDPQFTHYMFNTLYFNPAYAGLEGSTKFTAIHRSQWLGYQPTVGGGGAPTTQIISFSTPAYKIKSGFGAYVVNDRLGPQSNLEAQANYSYSIQLKGGGAGSISSRGGSANTSTYFAPNTGSRLSFGMKLGMYSQTVNFDLYRPIDPNDPKLNKQGKESQVRPDLAVGAFYQNQKYYVGLSVNHLLKSEFDFGLSQRNALEPHGYLTAGYFYDVNFDLRIQFSTLVKSDFTKTTFDLGGIAYYKDTMYGGLSFRQSEAVILLLGYSLLKDKSLKLGYGLDYVVNDQDAKQPTSQEVILSYSLPVNPASGKKVVRTPRYRH
jgi:type IX secretion system PorP/SprF family membrane protein